MTRKLPQISTDTKTTVSQADLWVSSYHCIGNVWIKELEWESEYRTPAERTQQNPHFHSIGYMIRYPNDLPSVVLEQTLNFILTTNIPTIPSSSLRDHCELMNLPELPVLWPPKFR